MPRPSSSITRWAALGLLLVAFALRLLRLDAQDIWWDEARNISVSLLPLRHIAPAPELDIHPPLYFYLLHVWTSLAGASAFSTRLLSVWFGVLAAALTFALARSLSADRGQGRMAALLALSVAAFSPFAVGEAQETRMYTLTWAVLAAGLLALQRALARPHERRRWALVAVLLAAAVATHYGVGLVLPAWAVFALVWAVRGPQRGRRLALLTATGLAAAALLLPLAPVMLRQIPGYTNPNLHAPTGGNYVGELARVFTVGPASSSGATGSAALGWVWLALVGGGALAGVFIKRGEGGRIRREHLALLAAWLAGGLALYYGVLLRRSAFDPRYISFVLPPLWALSGWALAGWRRLGRAAPWIAGLALAAITVPGLRADLYDPANFREDMRGVTAWLATRATPDDIILVDQRYPFGFYWQRWNNDPAGVPPAEPSWQAPAQYLFVDVHHLDQRLTELAGHARSIFWVTWYESDTDPRGATAALLAAYGSLADRAEFRGYRVEQWQMQPPVTFHLPSQFAPLDRRFENGMALVEGDWTGRQNPAAAGQPGLVVLRWQADQPSARPLKASLRVRDAQGQTLAQDDKVLLNDRHLRSNTWIPGTDTLAIYSLNLANAPAGDYTLTLVLYDEETLAPVGLADGSGVEPVIGDLRIR